MLKNVNFKENLEKCPNKDYNEDNCFLFDVELAIRDAIIGRPYARRKDVNLILWQRFHLGRRATEFMLTVLEEQGKIEIRNRGIYIKEMDG